MPDPEIITDSPRSRVNLRFLESDSWRWFMPADSILMQITSTGHLASIWITNIIDDLAGQEIAAFRKQVLRDTAPRT